MNFFNELEGQTFSDGQGSDFGVFAIIDESDLANGKAPGGGKIPWDQVFRDKLAFMLTNDGTPEPSEYRPFTHIPIGGGFGTTIFLFSCGDRRAAIDCTAIHADPSSALNNLRLSYGLVLPMIDYQGPPTATADNPVGKLVPGHNFIFAFAPGVDPEKYADDSTYTLTLPDGQTEKYLRTRVVGALTSVVPMRQGTIPAWRYLGRA